MELGKYSLGIGDRFAHEASAQLRAFQMAEHNGLMLSPVWNKSHREHTTVGSQPNSVKIAADEAVRELGWTAPYFIDADHIRMETVDGYLAGSNFFTIDVADSIGQPAGQEAKAFVHNHPELVGSVSIEGIDTPFELSAEGVERIAGKYLRAVQEAGRIYRRIADSLGAGSFIAEVSMDETDAPQTPPELLTILAAIADERIPIQTIAPKFTGRFNKGVDYVGEVAQFEREFNDDIAVIGYAVARYGLPQDLKLSVHSGSDKFSIYRPIHEAITRTGAGVHVKTAGTTWLEEIIGLAEGGGDGLAFAKQVYAEALGHQAELCAPYASVIDIRADRLPSAQEVNNWISEQFTSAVRHIPTNSGFNADMRQLLHVAYKIAAQAGERYTKLLGEYRDVIARNVTENLYSRHIAPLFLGGH